MKNQWLTSIRSVSERRAIVTSGEDNTSGSTSNEVLISWDDDDTFLVCVYNVSPDIPYAIMKAPINATAQDVLAQSFFKARRMENPNSFVLIEDNSTLFENLKFFLGGNHMLSDVRRIKK